MDFDVVIVGGGPAGLTAGIYCVRRGLEAVVVERKALGGTVKTASEIENWPGDRIVKGEDLSKRMADHARELGVEFVYNEVVALDLEGKEKTVTLRDRQLKCAAVILASGGKRPTLEIKGEKEHSGKGVSYCATCDGPFFKDKVVAVVGGGNLAVEDALYLSEITSKTVLICPALSAEPALIERLNKSDVEVLEDKVSEIRGADFVDTLCLESGLELKVQGVFLCEASKPSTEVADAAGVALDERGFVSVDLDMKTNIPGVYAAGDVTGRIPQIATAVGDGATAALRSYEYIKSTESV